MDKWMGRWIDGWIDKWMVRWTMDGGHIGIPALESQAGANIRTGRQAKLSWGEFIFGPRFHHKSKTNS